MGFFDTNVAVEQQEQQHNSSCNRRNTQSNRFSSHQRFRNNAMVTLTVFMISILMVMPLCVHASISETATTLTPVDELTTNFVVELPTTIATLISKQLVEAQTIIENNVAAVNNLNSKLSPTKADSGNLNEEDNEIFSDFKESQSVQVATNEDETKFGIQTEDLEETIRNSVKFEIEDASEQERLQSNVKENQDPSITSSTTHAPSKQPSNDIEINPKPLQTEIDVINRTFLSSHDLNTNGITDASITLNKNERSDREGRDFDAEGEQNQNSLDVKIDSQPDQDIEQDMKKEKLLNLTEYPLDAQKNSDNFENQKDNEILQDLENNNSNLLIVFNETLTATEVPPSFLFETKTETIIDMEENIVETTTTIPIEEKIHIVIKKQGVELNTDDTELKDVLSNVSAIKKEQTDNAYDYGEEMPYETEVELRTEQLEKDFKTIKNDFALEPHVEMTTVSIESEITTDSIVDDVDATTTIEIEISEDLNHITATTTVLEEELPLLNHPQNGGGTIEDPIAVAATFFEAYPSRVAGQTFNDNLAAESSQGVGKALPTRSINNETSTARSTIIITLSSCVALLFIIISVSIFVISFHRQHGTLDIEMQEQRCGKDTLDEEDAETRLKLLDVELPQLSAVVAVPEETDECL